MAGGTGGSAWKALKKFGKKATGQQISGCCVADVIDDITKKWTGGGGGGLPPSEIVGGVLRGDGDGTFEEVDAKDGIGYTKSGVIHKIDEKYLPDNGIVIIKAFGSADPSGSVDIDYTGTQISTMIQNGKVPIVTDGKRVLYYKETIEATPYNKIVFESEPFVVGSDEFNVYYWQSVLNVSGAKKIGYIHTVNPYEVLPKLENGEDGRLIVADNVGDYFVANADKGFGYIEEDGTVHKIDPKFLEAGALVVKFTKNSETQYQSDKTCIDIYSAFKEDVPIYGYFEADDATNVYQIIACKKDSTNQHIIQFASAVDVGTGSEKTKVLRVLTSITGSIQCKWSVSDYPLGGSVEKFVMDVTPTVSNSWTTNVTRANIYKAFTEGKEIVCRVKGQNDDYYYQRLVVCEKHADGSYNIQFEGCYVESGRSYKLKLQDAVEPMITAILVADDTDGYGYLDRSGNVHKIDPKFISDPIEVVFPDGLWTEIKNANYDLNKYDVTLSKKDKTPIEVVKYNDLLTAFKAGETIRIYPGDEFDSFYELEGKKGIKVYNELTYAYDEYNGLYIHTPGADIMLCENVGRSSNYFRIISKSNDNGIGDIVLKSFRGAYGQLLFENPDPEGNSLEWRDLPWDDIYEQWKSGKGVYILDSGVDRYRCDTMTCNERETADGTGYHCDSALFTLMNSDNFVANNFDYSAKIRVSTMQGRWVDYDEDLDYGGYMEGGESFTRDNAYLFPRSYNAIYAEYDFKNDEYTIETQSGIDAEVWSREFWESVMVIDSVVLLNEDEWDGYMKCKILSYDKSNKTAILRGAYIYYDDTDDIYKEKEYNFLLDDYTITSISVE